MPANFIGILLIIVGYIIGLGSVIVIDIHGFLGRKSGYWTRATISTHKVTKPLIWLGTLVMLLGTIVFYRQVGINYYAVVHWFLILILLANGAFLTFWVSPRLLKREADGQSEVLLPQKMQNAIMVSFLISIFGWWGSLFLFVVVVSSML